MLIISSTFLSFDTTPKFFTFEFSDHCLNHFSFKYLVLRRRFHVLAERNVLRRLEKLSVSHVCVFFWCNDILQNKNFKRFEKHFIQLSSFAMKNQRVSLIRFRGLRSDQDFDISEDLESKYKNYSQYAWGGPAILMLLLVGCALALNTDGKIDMRIDRQ